jgi:hypothetical protein
MSQACLQSESRFFQQKTHEPEAAEGVVDFSSVVKAPPEIG